MVGHALDAHIRATAITVHHPLGTCRMGWDGRDGGRRCALGSGCRSLARRRCIGDADLIGGNINAAVIMIAEKAADSSAIRRDDRH